MTGYQIKITIKGSKPPIWRRIFISEHYTFEQLHKAIQILFGWSMTYVYEFNIPSIHIKILGSFVELSKPKRLHFNRIPQDELHIFLEEGMRFTYRCEDYDGVAVIQVEEEKAMLISSTIHLLKWRGENPGVSEIEPNPVLFDPETVQDKLLFVDELNNLFPDLREDISEELNDVVMNLHDLLNEFQIRDLSLIITDTKDSRETIAVSSMPEGINIQIFDNETDFLRSVENVSPYMEFNLYANAYSVLLMDDPIPNGSLTGWISEDCRCLVKKMRTGFLPADVCDEEAQEIISVVKNLSLMLHKAGHKTLPPMSEGHMMLGTWKHGSMELTYPEIKLMSNTTGIRLGDKQIRDLSSCPAYPEEVYIDLITCPSDNFIVNNQMDVLFILEDEEYSTSQLLDRRFLKDFVTLNEAVLIQLCTFIEEYGRMKRIIVNNDNMHSMVEGFCEDLHIPLVLDEFITDAQRELLGTELEEGNDLLEQLSHLDKNEFLQFMDNLDEDQMAEISNLISDYILEEDEDDDFPPRQPQKKVFDA